MFLIDFHIIADSKFMSYLPSVMATATMIHVFNSVEPSLGDEYKNQLLGILGINKVSVICYCFFYAIIIISVLVILMNVK